MYTRLWHRLHALPIDYAAHKTLRPSTTPLAQLPIELPLPTALSEYAHARTRACAIRGTGCLITAWSIPSTVLLTDFQTVWFLIHRLGIRMPSYNKTPLKCHPKCCHLGSQPASFINRPELYLTADLLLHYVSCGVLGLSLQRHNSFWRVPGS